MKFLYPEFLWALSVLAVPIIIHLFNFRKFKKVYFSNIQLLKEVKQETKSKSQLKHLLVLLARLLALATLVLAFAHPYIPNNTIQEKKPFKSVGIFVDNSFSMDAKGTNGNLLQQAKSKAREIVNSYSIADKFQVLTNDFEGIHQRFYGKSEVMDIIDGVAPTAVTRTISDVISKLQTNIAHQDQSDNQIFILSDFQKNIADLNNVVSDSTAPVFLGWFQQKASRDNFWIDSIWFETPIRKVKSEEILKARIKCISAEPANVHLSLSINGNSRGFSNSQLDSNGTTICEIPFSVDDFGIKNGKVSLSEYPNPDLFFDDSYFFSYTIDPKIKVLSIIDPLTDTNNALNTLFTDSVFAFTQKSSKNLDYGKFKEQNLIVLNSPNDLSTGLIKELNKFVTNGGSLLIVPNFNNLEAYNKLTLSINSGRFTRLDTTTQQASYIDFKNVLYQGVFEKIPDNLDLPQVFSHVAIEQFSNTGAVDLMRLQNGRPFLSFNEFQAGKVYLLATELNRSQSNFTQHALFVTSLFRIAEFSQFKQSLAFQIGRDNIIPLNVLDIKADQLTVRSEDNKMKFIPRLASRGNKSTIILNNQVKDAGTYFIEYSDSLIQSVGLNFDRIESHTACYNEKELQNMVNELGPGSGIQLLELENRELSLANIASDHDYWKLFIVLTLLFLATEIALIKLWK